ncbi:MAG: DUF2779 domain-containing protein [Methylacidiphilales bacterium]|nr:DUF2779 domain-containing protein [Candidatus Methylacidiphilales bacterium]
MRIVNQSISFSKLNNLRHCKKKFVLSSQDRIQKDTPQDNKTLFNQESREITKYFINNTTKDKNYKDANFDATDTAILCQTKNLFISRPAYLYQDIPITFPLLFSLGEKKIQLFELKSIINIRKHHYELLALKVHLLQLMGWEIVSTTLVNINHDFIYQGDSQYDGLFKFHDLSQTILEHIEGGKAILNEARLLLLLGNIPDTAMGKHCEFPNQCYFFSHCSEHKVKPTNSLLSTNMLESINKTISKLPRPIYFFDVEAISFTIPRWKGCKPFDKIPFQFSCHVLTEDGALHHHEFIDTSGEYPVKQFSEALVKAIRHEGSVLVYDISLERHSVKLCQKTNPEIASELLRIDRSLVDLLPIIRSAIASDKSSQEKFSLNLKSLVHGIDPTLTYSNLAGVKNGYEIQNAYIRCIDSSTTHEKKEEIRTHMGAYCKRDTEVLVALLQKLATVN